LSECPRCGEDIPPDSNYCPNCGFQIDAKTDEENVGLTRLKYDIRAQSKWLWRFLSYMLDSIIVGIFTGIALLLVLVPSVIGTLLTMEWFSIRNIINFPFLIGLFQVAYFTLLEGWYGASIGKQVLGLRIYSVREGNPSLIKIIIRNISKLHLGFLILDILFGLLLTSDPELKITDKLAGTRVIRSRNFSSGFMGVERNLSRSRGMNEDIKRKRKNIDDIIGGVGFGVFLIVAAVILTQFPNIPGDFLNWVTTIRGPQDIVPPISLLRPFVWFILSMGIWSFLAGALKIAMGRVMKSSIRDIFGGFSSLAVAYLVREYIDGGLPERTLWPLIIIILGLSVLLTAITNMIIEK
jgi:uncharacterized RDD family membrane protein YckC